MKKTLALLLALIMIFALAAPVMAANNGSITISNSVTNADYKIYRVFDASINGSGAISYTYSGTLPANNYFAQDSYGYITVKDAAKDATGALTADAVSFLGTIKGTVADTAKGNGGELTFSNLAYGYYYVETSSGAAVTVTSTNPNATVVDKNSNGPGPVDPENPTYKTADKESASIGENVNYTIQWKATNHVVKDGKAEQITKYTVTDDSSNLVIDWDTLKITVDGKVITNYTVDKGTAIENEDENKYNTTNVINIPWVDADGNSLYDSPVNVVITYTAEVYKYGEANNTATISYDTKDGTTPLDPPGHVYVKNYQLEIYKIDSKTKEKYNIVKARDLFVHGDEDLTLGGAEFELYYDAGLTRKVQLVEESFYNEETGRTDASYRLAAKEEYNAAGFESAVIKYGCKDGVGFYEVNGLGEGTYYLVEIKAPDGYNRLTAPVAVTIKDDDYDTWDNDVIVENSTGAELPSTGGIGTTVFYIVGGLLMVGAAVVLVTRKKVGADK